MTRTGWAIVTALVLAVALTFASVVWRLENARRELAALQLAPQQHAVEVAAARVETVTVQLHAAERVVTQTIHAVRVDTLMLAPTTAADTAKAVGQLSTLATAHDSLQRACNALVITCDEFRAATALKDRAQSDEIAGLKAARSHEQPSRLSAVWEKVDGPVLFVAGILAGSRLH